MGGRHYHRTHYSSSRRSGHKNKSSPEADGITLTVFVAVEIYATFIIASILLSVYDEPYYYLRGEWQRPALLAHILLALFAFPLIIRIIHKIGTKHWGEARIPYIIAGVLGLAYYILYPIIVWLPKSIGSIQENLEDKFYNNSYVVEYGMIMKMMNESDPTKIAFEGPQFVYDKYFGAATVFNVFFYLSFAGIIMSLCTPCAPFLFFTG